MAGIPVLSAQDFPGNTLKMILRLVLALSLCALTISSASSMPAIVPRPNEIKMGDGVFEWRIGTSVQAEAEASEALDLLRTYMGTLVGTIRAGAPVTFERSSELSGEAYELEITPTKLALRAGTSAGWQNAIQTLRQLLPPDQLGKPIDAPVTLPCLLIKDAPRFRWRGLMIDCGRHFFSKEYIEKFLDVMALNKLNVFHWHLIDNAGWRLEIKKYPLLTEIGSFNNLYGHRSGGFYTQEDAKEIVRYAAQRNIMVVPEIEMPGHSQASLASYQFLSCAGPYKVATDVRGRIDANLNVGSDKTYQFIDDVLSEVSQIFPSEFLHVGGDEVDKGSWLANPDCQALMKAEGLNDGEALQSYFIRRAQAIVTSKGKRLIGWDEILQGGLAPGAIVMVWHESKVSAAVGSGEEVIMTPRQPLYFDKDYSTNSVEKVYNYDPVPKGARPEQASRILGAQGSLWTESVSFPAALEDRTYPRACALAEATWSSQPKDFAGFDKRMGAHLRRLEALGVHCHDSNFKKFGSWRPSATLKAPKITEWKATEWVVGNAENQVRFRFTGGANALEIEAVELLADNVVIASDKHHGIAGEVSKDNVFVLPVPALTSGSSITVRATISGQGGIDSNGDIEVKR